MEPDFGPHVREAGEALRAVRWAARLCLSVEASPARRGWIKQDRSPVTLTDLASQAKCAVLAAGRADLIVLLIAPSKPDYWERIWDHAAGSLLVEEAGGKVRELRGEALDFGRGRQMRADLGVVASNGRLHAAVLNAIRAASADRTPGSTLA